MKEHVDEKLSDQKVNYMPTDELKEFLKNNVEIVVGHLKPTTNKKKQ